MLATIINGCVISVFFTWGPNPDQGYVFFILSGLWGIADSIWQAQINGINIPYKSYPTIDSGFFVS